MSISSPGTPIGTPLGTPAPTPPDTYTVNRSQDGAQVRADLDLETAKSECAILNGQARIQTGLTASIHDKHERLVQGPRAIFGSMFHGEISQYEVRSTASGLVIA